MGYVKQLFLSFKRTLHTNICVYPSCKLCDLTLNIVINYFVLLCLKIRPIQSSITHIYGDLSPLQLCIVSFFYSFNCFTENIPEKRSLTTEAVLGGAVTGFLSVCLTYIVIMMVKQKIKYVKSKHNTQVVYNL